MSARERILVVSHGHPEFALGGGEIAAYQLYQAYREHPDVEDAWFLARADRAGWPSGHIGLRRPGEYLWDQGMHDWHRMTGVHRASLFEGLAELVTQLRPTTIHLHHYAHIGLEVLVALRRILPGVRLVLTLHEFMLMCRHNGQMVKTESLRLCDRSTPLDCHRCYPDTSVESFWLRDEFVRDRLQVVDAFVTPSDFVRERHIAWGLPADRLRTIENSLPAPAPLGPRRLSAGERRNRFAFFGQINPYKGLDLLLRALGELSADEQSQLHVEVHGAHFEHQSRALRRAIERLLEPLRDSGVLQWIGPYRPSDLPARMAEIDWVLVPSIWWENSPLVIQEAFALGRPVVCSNIGGMAEKVRHDVDGVHVPVGHPRAWARTLLELGQSDGLWERLAAGIRRPAAARAIADAHLAWFASAAPRH